MVDLILKSRPQASRLRRSPSQVAVSAALLITISASLLEEASALELQKTAPAADASSPSSSWTLNEDSWNQWWSYSGVSGPAYWGLLNTDWFMCDRGRRQSPIDLETKALVYDPHLEPLRADNNLITGVLYNDGHAIVFNGSQAAVVRSNWLRDMQLASRDNANSNTTTPPITEQRHLISRRRPKTSEIFAPDEHSARVHLIDSSAGFEIERSDGGGGESGEVQLQGAEPAGLQRAPMLLRGQTNGIELGESALSQPNGDSPDSTAGDTSESSTSDQIHLNGAGLDYSYRFEMMQFKYGTSSEWGSEHRIDGRAFAAELQVFAYNWQLYKGFDEASSRPRGLLAISLLVDAISPTGQLANEADRPEASHNNQKSLPDGGGGDGGGQPQTSKQRPASEQLERLLVSAANSLQHRGAFESHREFNLTALLAEGGEQFVTYEGSLTQPGCHETVTWLVLNRPLYVSAQILEKLRSLSADEQSASNPTGSLIAGNTRPAQPVNKRPVRTNIRPPRLTSAASSTPDHEFCPRLWTRYRYARNAPDSQSLPVGIAANQLN